MLPSNTSIYDLIGGEPAVSALVSRFYDYMAEHEAPLARLHRCDGEGRVDAEAQERFRLFLIGWLGGPQTYMATHGHPRLRMRHGNVPIGSEMRDAWLRCMNAAMAPAGYSADVIDHLHHAFAQVANFLRNVADPASPG